MSSLNLNKVAELIIDKETTDLLVGDVQAKAVAEFMDKFWQGSTRSEEYKEMMEAAYAAGVEVGARRLITLLLQHLRDDLKANNNGRYQQY